jgi:hypothetical protein
MKAGAKPKGKMATKKKGGPKAARRSFSNG